MSARDRLLMTVVMVVLVLQEQVLVGAVGRECDSGDAQAREETLEAIPAGEGTSVPPSFTAE